jgi:hypothetical protein
LGPVALGLVHGAEVHREGIELLAERADVIGALIESCQHPETLHAKGDRIDKHAEALEPSLDVPLF